MYRSGFRRRFALAVSLLLALSAPAWAAWKQGLAAYSAGDFGAALNEWRPLAERGDVRAEEMLGYMYDLGEGVAENDAAAAKWYLLAASQGSPDAQLNLGILYFDGSGVPKDDVAALMWLSLAAATWIPEVREMAVQARDRDASSMTPDQISRARELTNAWKPR